MVLVINYAKVLVNNLDNFGGPPEDFLLSINLTKNGKQITTLE